MAVYITLHKAWNNPQELIVQKLVFTQIQEITQKKDHVFVTLQNPKTRFTLELKLEKDTLHKILSR